MKSRNQKNQSTGILVEIHQGGRLIAALPLGSDPIEVTLRDARSGLPLGSLSARGPVLGHIDEQPLPSVTRAPSDDFTMPLPERTRSVGEPTGDLDRSEPETETAEAPHPASASPVAVPNLARDARHPHTDEQTSPALLPMQPRRGTLTASQTRPRRGHTTARTPEPTLSEHLESITDEHTVSGLLEEAIEAHAIPPAEVWTRNASEWRSAGRLHPGHRATARRGWVSLELDGHLVAFPGPELSGTATMVDGTTIELRKGGKRVRLPPGSSVILRGTGHGLYVRADPPLPSH